MSVRKDRSPVAGARAGLAATVPMTAAMAAINQLPPRQPSQHSWRRVAEQILPHLVWGFATGLLTGRWSEANGSIRKKP